MAREAATWETATTPNSALKTSPRQTHLGTLFGSSRSLSMAMATGAHSRSAPKSPMRNATLLWSTYGRAYSLSDSVGITTATNRTKNPNHTFAASCPRSEKGRQLTNSRVAGWSDRSGVYGIDRYCVSLQRRCLTHSVVPRSLLVRRSVGPESAGVANEWRTRSRRRCRCLQKLERWLEPRYDWPGCHPADCRSG